MPDYETRARPFPAAAYDGFMLELLLDWERILSTQVARINNKLRKSP